MFIPEALTGTGYHIVLLLHVLTVIVGFAPLWLTPVMIRLTAAGDKAARPERTELDRAVHQFVIVGSRIQAKATEVSRPPEKEIPTFSPICSEARTLDMWKVYWSNGA